MDDESRKHLRQCWGCDCDGESHKLGVRPVGATRATVEKIADGIEKLTGYRPPTCPWRAMWDPLVGPIIDIARMGEEVPGAPALRDDDPQILWDAVNVYLRAKRSVLRSDEAEEIKRLQAQRKKT